MMLCLNRFLRSHFSRVAAIHIHICRLFNREESCICSIICFVCQCEPPHHTHPFDLLFLVNHQPTWTDYTMVYLSLLERFINVLLSSAICPNPPHPCDIPPVPVPVFTGLVRVQSISSMGGGTSVISGHSHCGNRFS